jgi:hypothetical protein
VSNQPGAGPDGLSFEGPDYFLAHPGLFGIERVFLRKHPRPEHNSILPGTLLWDNENKRQYYLFADELAGFKAPNDSAAGGTDVSEKEVTLRAGLLFRSPSYFLPADQLGTFGEESVLFKKHPRPERNAVIPGALLWDSGHTRLFFAFAQELVTLDQLFGRV